MPPFWAVYITVDNADETLSKAEAAGGTVVVGAMDVLDVGRFGVIQDAVGSFISVWQAGKHIGAELVNEPGTFAWSELATSDLAAARDFYRSVFGWGVEPGRKQRKRPPSPSAPSGACCDLAVPTAPGRVSFPPGRFGLPSKIVTSPPPS